MPITTTTTTTVSVNMQLGGTELTLADLTLFPTFVFLCFYMPRVFGWDEDNGSSPTGKGVFYKRPHLRDWCAPRPSSTHASPTPTRHPPPPHYLASPPHHLTTSTTSLKVL